MQEQDTSVVDSRNLLERMQSVEQGLMNLKTSKLSPFTQSEVLDRLEQLEKKMKEQRIQFETHLEKEAMKKQMAENKLSESFIDAPSPKESISASLEISQPSTPSPQPLEDRSAVVLTEESKATDLSDSCSTSKELERYEYSLYNGPAYMFLAKGSTGAESSVGGNEKSLRIL